MGKEQQEKQTNKCRKIIIGLKIKKKKKKKRKTPQNCKRPMQRQRFMTTIKSASGEKKISSKA